MSLPLPRCAVWLLLLAVGSTPAFAAPAAPSYSCPSTSVMPQATAPVPPGGPAQTPVDVTADRVDVEGNISTFSGNVEVRYQDEVLNADRVVYDRVKDQIEASGNVRARNVVGDALDTTFFQFNRSASTGHTEKVIFRFRGDRARGDARHIYFRSRNEVELDKARYTYCAPGQDDWFIVARNIELDYERDIGSAYNAYITFMSVPVFYWPYISFPLSDKRKSGFLAPYFGSDRGSGWYIAAPYYLNLAPNYDATLTPRFLEKRGLQALTEGRYLGGSYDGTLNFDYLPNDRLYGADRWAVRYLHHQYMTPLWTAEANYNQVSDKQYIPDFTIGYTGSVPSHVPQVLATNYSDEIWRGYARLFAYQTVDPSTTETPYKRLPELSLIGDLPVGVDRPRYEFGGEFVNFEHQSKLSGERLALYPAVSLPLRNRYGFFTPRAGLRFTQYSLKSAPGENAPSSGIPLYSVDSGLIFEREVEVADAHHTQTFEPRLFYVYAPYHNQDTLPNFDTGLQDFTYTNLFRENRFFGGDRVGDANQLVIGATTRVLDPLGAEWLRLSLGEIYYFQRPQVFVNPAHASLVTNDASYLVEQSRLRLGQPWYLRNDLQWDPYTQDVRKSSTYLQYSPRSDDILNLGHLYSNLPPGTTDTTATAQEQQIEASTQWRVTQRWSALAQVVYSLSSHQNRESYVGVEYNACCWIARVYAQRVISTVGGQTDQFEQINKFYFEFELSGLVRVGAPKITPLSQGNFIFQD